MAADMSEELAQSLRFFIETATKNRDAHSSLLVKNMTATEPNKETAAIQTGAVDALDALLDSVAGAQAMRALQKFETQR